MMEIPDHPVGSRWLWVGTEGQSDEKMRVVKVTKNTVTMKSESEGWTVKFGEKEKAFRSGKLIRITIDPEEETL